MSADRVYWDSDVFLAWLLGEAGRADECRAVVEAAESGEVVIVTSAITLTEVIYLKGHTRLPAEAEPRITAFFESVYIRVQRLDRSTAERARGLIWETNLKPKDSIHVATALGVGVRSMNTYDKVLLALTEKIGDPPLVIEHPGKGLTAALFPDA